MATLILGIVGSVMKIAAALVGDRVVAKWVAAFKHWWRTIASADLKKAAEDEYNLLLEDWKKLQQDRGPLRPPE